MHPRTLPHALVTVALALGACAGASAQAQKAAGKEVRTPSGVRYTDLRPGRGDEASLGKIVEVHYTGWLEDGTRIDSSRDRNHPLTFRLGAGDALKGWDEGLVGMRVGGRRRLVIPPGLGFGRQGVGNVVPPNAVLFYEFELLSVR